jgi:two-component system, sensor histidine kinase
MSNEKKYTKYKFRNNSIRRKLFTIFGLMVLLIGFELFVLSFAMSSMSSVRGFVEGEALWSKAQKDAVLSLHAFLVTEKVDFYEKYKKNLDVTLGSRQARLEIEKSKPDQEKLYKGFISGKVHPDDIQGMIKLLYYFRHTDVIKHVIKLWSDADKIVDELVFLGESIRAKVNRNTLNYTDYQYFSDRLDSINTRATALESEFSAVLSAGSRSLEAILFMVVLFIALTVGATGLLCIYLFSRDLTRGLKDLTHAARDIGKGHFDKKVKVRSSDELGLLAESINTMADEIELNVGMREEAENLNQVKSAFLANMSHEIRTPLGLILGFTHLMENTLLEENERVKFLKIVKKSAESLTDVINDILDISKVESGHLTIKKDDFCLSEIILDLKRLLQLRTQEKGLELEIFIEPDVPVYIRSDAVRLRQVLLNLLGNAIKFTEKGKVSLIVSKSGDLLVFDIYDSGCGIAEKDFKIIFEAFRQSDNGYTRIAGGTGLGLPLSKHLAHLLGGDLILKKSEIHVGSQFQVTIKYDPAITEGSPAHLDKSHEGSIRELNLVGLKILIVDDSQDNQFLIKAMLKKWGGDVDLASNGQECLEKVKTHNYDIVLMDLQMPVMSGVDATSALRNLGFTMPIVALTAHAMKEVAQQCEHVGFSGFVSKPIKIEKLMLTISRLLKPIGI